MEIIIQFIYMDGYQCFIFLFVFYFFFVKFYFLKLSDFLDIGFDDSFSEIFLLYIEDDLDSFIEVFNFVRDGFLDFLDDIIQCFSNFIILFEFQEIFFIVSFFDVFNFFQKFVFCVMDFSDIFLLFDFKDVLFRVLEFSDFICLDVNSEE